MSKVQKQHQSQQGYQGGGDSRGINNRPGEALENIPLELRRLPNWLWTSKTKQPITLADENGKVGDWNDPALLVTFEEAMRKSRSGIGFTPFAKDGYCFLDLDESLVGEMPSEFAREVLNLFGQSYTEISTSKNGLHIVVRGQLSKPVVLGRDYWPRRIEILPFNRYVKMTGQIFEERRFIEDHQAELDQLFERVMAIRAEVRGEKPPRLKELTLVKSAIKSGGKRRDRSKEHHRHIKELARRGFSPEKIKEIMDDTFRNCTKWIPRGQSYQEATIRNAIADL